MVKEFVIFTNRAAFDAFLTRVNTAMGFPRVGNRASDGVPQPTKQQTITYTTAKRHELDSDLRIVGIIDEKLTDRTGLDVRTEQQVKDEGFLKDVIEVSTPTGPVSP